MPSWTGKLGIRLVPPLSYGQQNVVRDVQKEKKERMQKRLWEPARCSSASTAGEMSQRRGEAERTLLMHLCYIWDSGTGSPETHQDLPLKAPGARQACTSTSPAARLCLVESRTRLVLLRRLSRALTLLGSNGARREMAVAVNKHFLLQYCQICVKKRIPKGERIIIDITAKENCPSSLLHFQVAVYPWALIINNNNNNNNSNRIPRLLQK